MKGKNVFITGTNRGLGKAFLEEFAKRGANVIAHARQETSEFKGMCSDISTKLKSLRWSTFTPDFFTPCSSRLFIHCPNPDKSVVIVGMPNAILSSGVYPHGS